MLIDGYWISLYFWLTIKIKTMSNDIQYNERRSKNRSLAGIILIAAGALYLLNQFSFFFLPYWLFTWPMILIVIGLASGIRHNFQRPRAYFMMLIGGIFLLNYIPGIHIFYIWPLLMIAVGLRMLFVKDHRWYDGRWDRRHDWKQDNTADHASL
jgi:hypothetical protein